ncbi:phage terminase large subunit family protein [Rickettsiales bacterium]|nr:phage terminase large subunit family protein [Rickettsiales bacterium]
MSQWADQYRRLSPEASSEPGKWVTDRAPYQRGMMDAVNKPGVSEVVYMTSSQIGKTEIINNIIGYFMHQDPSPLLLIQPTLDMAETWSKDRLAPMIRDTDELAELLGDPRSRNSNNTLLHKKFVGGHITMAGANSPASLASRPIRIVLLDEEDRYPHSAGTEGDPGSLAYKRTTTFWNRLLVSASTPTNEGESKIAARYEQSDQQKYYVPCPECGAFQVLSWAQVKFEKRQPKTTHYECEHCKAKLQESDKIWMLARGEWKAEAAFNGIAGFHISELYSPWVKWSEMVVNFFKAKRLPETLKVWVNTSLGETWKEATEGIDPSGLLGRKENWGRISPEGVVVITAGVDVQDDRLEIELIGWGLGQESWSLQYHVLHGDPAQLKVWEDLDKVLQQMVTTTDGRTLAISCACVDTGGHHTQKVYEYCKNREHQRVYAIKGASQIGKPLVSKFSRNNKLRVKLFSIGTDTAKQMIYSRLKIHQPGAGYCHFPADYPEKYFKQLTAERIQTKFINGHPTRIWVMPKGRRNEALDCRVYGLAALHILNPNLDALAKEQERERLKQKEEQQPESSQTSEWLGYEDWNFN